MPAKGEKSTAFTRRLLHKSLKMKKRFTLLALLCPAILYAQNTPLKDTTLLQPVEITATRATDNSPVTKTLVTRKQIDNLNFGPDLPFILDQTPGVVVNSDAGNGMGYTGIRIRGADASRINVTINGIPYNDAESQGTFFVDVPDLASSAGNIQVQRGVGSSTNGAGAFGASINLSTNEIKEKPALNLSSSMGSFHSFKNTLSINSGLLKKHFTIDGRLSYLRSAGYIDRAFSRLGSGFISAAYISKNNSLRFNYITGKEKTYQAWNGIDAATLDTNRTFNTAGTEKPGQPYQNETDNYLQNHYQLFFNHKFTTVFKSSIAIFLTRGKGYYEQYKAGEKFSDYGLGNYHEGSDIITQSDLIRRLWLDNYFYGTVVSAEYKKDNTEIVFGGAWTGYDGRHYGQIIWADVENAVPANYEWYRLSAYKNDYSIFGKWTQQIARHWFTYVDLQGRIVHYKINGFRNNPDIISNHQYHFFNPKAGITYRNKFFTGYISYGRASKEPNRDDFEASAFDQPKPEKLNDIEAGIEIKKGTTSAGINFYYMFYKDQLILTGKINDAGAYTRTNTPKSYRLGIEIQAKSKPFNWLEWSGNICLSRNRVKAFTEYIDDYDIGGQTEKIYRHTPIAFSPSITGSLNLCLIPVNNLEINFVSKYVNRQYLDNSGLKARSLNPYFLENIRIAYTIKPKNIGGIELYFNANNIFSKKYVPNGYSFSYIYGGEVNTENYYFPMATLNFAGGINIHL